MVSKLIGSGSCDLLGQSLRMHHGNGAVVSWCCRCMHALILNPVLGQVDSGHCQDKLAESFVMESLISLVLRDRQEDETAPPLQREAAVWAIRAVGSMARRNSANKERLARLGTCEKLLPLFHSFVGADLTQKEQDDVLESLCWCIGNLGSPDESNQTLLGQQGVHHIVGYALLVNSSLVSLITSTEDKIVSGNGSSKKAGSRSVSVLVVQEALRALRSLCHNHSANLQLFFEWRWSPSSSSSSSNVEVNLTDSGSGVQLCEVLADLLLSSRERSEVLQWSGYAIASLSMEVRFLKRLGSLRVCEYAVDSLNRLHFLLFGPSTGLSLISLH